MGRVLRKTFSEDYEDLTNHPEMIIDYVIAAMTTKSEPSVISTQAHGSP